jgi:archaellum biogenesis protein FlaJ (TadC family)
MFTFVKATAHASISNGSLAGLLIALFLFTDAYAAQSEFEQLPSWVQVLLLWPFLVVLGAMLLVLCATMLAVPAVGIYGLWMIYKAAHQRWIRHTSALTDVTNRDAN